MSSVLLTWTPSAVITRNLASGSLSPTLIVIVTSPQMMRMFGRAAYFAHNIRKLTETATGRPVHRSVMISAQTPSAFVARENRFTLFRIML
jgi:hypothetical protein